MVGQKTREQPASNESVFHKNQRGTSTSCEGRAPVLVNGMGEPLAIAFGPRREHPTEHEAPFVCVSGKFGQLAFISKISFQVFFNEKRKHWRKSLDAKGSISPNLVHCREYHPTRLAICTVVFVFQKWQTGRRFSPCTQWATLSISLS